MMKVVNGWIVAVAIGSMMAMPSFEAVADEKKVEKSSDTNSLVDGFTCVRFRQGGIAALKLKLIETCNLNKPFSMGATDIGVDEAYTFCCHKK